MVTGALSTSPAVTDMAGRKLTPKSGPHHLHQCRKGGGGEGLFITCGLGRPQTTGGQGVVPQAVAIFEQDQVFTLKG